MSMTDLQNALENMPEADRIKLAEERAKSHAFAIPDRGHEWSGSAGVDDDGRVVFTSGARAVRAAALIIVSRYLRDQDIAHADAPPHLQENWRERSRGNFIMPPDYPGAIYDDVAAQWATWRAPGDALNIDNMISYLWDLGLHLQTPGVLLDMTMIDMGVHSAGIVP